MAGMGPVRSHHQREEGYESGNNLRAGMPVWNRRKAGAVWMGRRWRSGDGTWIAGTGVTHVYSVMNNPRWTKGCAVKIFVVVLRGPLLTGGMGGRGLFPHVHP